MSEQKPPKLIVTVKLVNGETMEHTLDVPSHLGKAMAFVEFWVNHIGDALTRGKARFLWLPNPGICYNPDNVLWVSMNAIEATELEELIKRAQEKLGFHKD